MAKVNVTIEATHKGNPDKELTAAMIANALQHTGLFSTVTVTENPVRLSEEIEEKFGDDSEEVA